MVKVLRSESVSARLYSVFTYFEIVLKFFHKDFLLIFRLFLANF